MEAIKMINTENVMQSGKEQVKAFLLENPEHKHWLRGVSYRPEDFETYDPENIFDEIWEELGSGSGCYSRQQLPGAD